MANTRRMNRLEELGRVDSEKAYTKKGKKNLKAEKKRIVKELKGGGMMGRRMGYQSGMSVKGDDKRDIRKTESMIGASRSSKREKGRTNKPISRSKNPGLLAMSKTAKGKEAVKKMKFNPDRIVAKDGTNPFNKQKNIIDKQGKRGIIVGTGTMQKAPSKVSTKRKGSR